MYTRVPAELTILFPIIMFGLVVMLVLFLRWFTYRERMAMIERGIPLPQQKSEHPKQNLIRGLFTALVGIALTIGLFTIGIGPWLLVGLIPLFIGLALILVHVVSLPAASQENVTEPEKEEVKSEPEEIIHDEEKEEEQQEDDEDRTAITKEEETDEEKQNY